MLPSIERISAKVDAELKRVLDKITTLLEAIRKIPYLDGVLLVDLAATTGGAAFVHGLGRTPRGVLVLTSNSGLVFAPKVSWNDRTVTLVSYPVDSVTTVWVF